MRYSFENLVTDTNGSEATVAEIAGVQMDAVSAADATSLAEAVDIQSDVQNLVIEMDGNEISIETVQDAADAADAAEEAGEKMLEAAEAGEEPSVATVEALNLLLARAMKGTGKTGSMTMSAESFAVGRNRKAAYKASAESIIESAKDLYRSAIAWIKKMIARAVEWFQAKFGTGARLQSAFQKLVNKIASQGSKVLSAETEIPARRYAALMWAANAVPAKVPGDVPHTTVLNNILSNVKQADHILDAAVVFSKDFSAKMDKLAAHAADPSQGQDDYGNPVALKSLNEGSCFGIVFSNTGQGKEAVFVANNVDKDLVPSDANITVASEQTVKGLLPAARACYDFSRTLTIVNVMSGELKKSADKTIKVLEKAAQTAAKASSTATPGSGPKMSNHASKMLAKIATKEVTTAIKVAQTASVKIGFSGMAVSLAFLSALATKTEKADD